MLPSTGYFKAIACPFYEGGSCDRPYCHFKHARREEAPIVLAPPAATEATEKAGKTAAVGCGTAGDATNTLSQLVSEAVKKVLAEQQVIDKEEISQNIVSKVVEQLKPTLAGSLQSNSVAAETPVLPKPVVNSSTCTYNPTPISELKKRHISIPIYNPVRESKVTAKRKGSPDERTRSWHSILMKNDDSDESTYKPTPVSGSSDPIPGYVPTAKSSTVSTPVTYDPSAIECYASKSKESYYPKPKKRREEYVPKKVKTTLSIESHDSYDMDVANQDSSSQDFMDIEPRFSDDEEDEKIKQVEKKEKESKQKLATQEKENRDLKQTDKADSKSGVSSSSKRSWSEQKHSESEKRSKTEEQVNGSKHKREDEKDSRKKEEKKHTSKHDDKTKHSSRSSSKHSSSSKDSKKKDSRDKERRDKEKDREKKDCSRHDSHKSKKSYKSDKESSDKHKKSSSSPREDKKKSSSGKHSDRSSRSSRRDKNSSKSSSSSSRKENEVDERMYLSEKDLFDDSDVDVEEECYKIFQEYEESDQPKPSKVSLYQMKSEEKDDEEVGKKRVAHTSAESSIVRKPGPSQPIKKQPNPQQKLYERWRLMKEAAADKAKAATCTESQSVPTTDKTATSPRSLFPKSSLLPHPKDNHAFNGNGKIRIAHVPLAMSLALSKKPVLEKPKEPELKTPAQTSKDRPRVAHVPQIVPQLIRPEPLEGSTQKFSLNVRQFYVNMMHDVCIQIYTNGEDAAQRALSEELTCHERCKALNVYKNSCMLAIHRLKKELEQDKTDDISVASVSRLVSHEAVLAGKSKGSWSVMKPKKIITNFKGPVLYNKLTKWILYEQQLKDNGYPRPHPDEHKGHAKIYVIDNRSHSKQSKVPNERTCVRCGENYMVNKKGLAVRQQNCIYHWGRKFTVRGEGRYSCCQQYGSASGCSDAATHVWDYVDYENLKGYVKTLPKDIPDEEQGVFSLDCEMSYTTQGLELTRVTVINEDCQVVYETLVRPENPIIDYNTRFSGITAEAMKDVTTTIFDVQATLLTMFSSKTILVGHSLESDFKALKLIHDTVVDTSIMFPHRNGPPHKRALKNLCSEYLRKIIQNDVGGHDSNEDAVACMELVLWKVKEEAKLQ